MTEISPRTAEALGIRLFLDINGDARQAVNLIDQGASLNVANAEGVTTLMCAAAGRKNDVLKAMLHSGRDIGLEARDNHGWTALITAAHRGNAETVWLLLEAGADPTAQDAMGRTAFDYAKDDGDKAKMRLIAAATGTSSPRMETPGKSARRNFGPFN